MAKTNTLTEIFPTGIGSQFGSFGVTAPTWVNAGDGSGYMSIPVTTDVASVYTIGTWDLTDSYVFARVTFPAGGNGTKQNAFEVSDTSSTGTNRARFYRLNATDLRFALVTGGTEVSGVTITYSATDHLYLRFRHASSTLYWDTSPDGRTWTNQHSYAAPSWGTGLTLIYPRVRGFRAGAETDSFVLFDNVNTPEPIQGAATAAQASALTAAGTRVAPAGTTTAAQATALAVAGDFFRPSAGLIDAFDDGTIDTVLWPTVTGVPVEAGGALTVPCTAGYDGVQSANVWRLTGSSVAVRVSALPTLLPSTQGALQVMANADFNNRVEIVAESVGGVRSLTLRQVVAGVTDDTSITYDPTDHAYWRIREAAGTLYWETSANGTAWTTRRSATTTLNLTLVAVALVSGYWGAETPPVGSTVFDSVNVLDTAVTGTATLTQTTGLTAAGTAVAVATATATQTSTVTAAGVRIVPASAALSQGAAVTAAAVRIALGSAMLAQATALTADAGAIAVGSAALAQGSAVTAAGTRVVPGTAVLTAGTTAAPSPLLLIPSGPLTLSEATALLADADGNVSASAAVAQATALTTSARQIVLASASADQASALITSAVAVSAGNGADVTTVTTLTVVGGQIAPGSAAVSATAVLEVAALVVTAGTAALSQGSALTVSGTRVVPASAGLTAGTALGALAAVMAIAGPIPLGQSQTLAASGAVTAHFAVFGWRSFEEIGATESVEIDVGVRGGR